MEKTYISDSKLVIKPVYISDGVPIFKPTMEEFSDFYQFNKAINKYGMQSGIVKIVPPPEWKKLIEGIYTNENLEQVRIKNPIVQNINGIGGGVFTSQNIEKARTFNIFQWKDLSEKSNYQPPANRGKARGNPCSINVRPEASTSVDRMYDMDTSQFTAERCEQLEKVYWRSLTYAEPMYGADMLGSLFDENFDTWNVAKLPNILDLMDTKLPGVNEAYLYAGLWKATFAWHLEDQDLYSINYLHFGAPKQWYSIPQSNCDKFYELMKDTFYEEYSACTEFLRHKTFLASPSFLEKNGVSYNKVVHNAGEFIITYPYGYHAGFNYGFNLAESVNFALDDWFEYAEKTKKCECISDSVGINIKQIYCKFKGIPYKSESSDKAEEIGDATGKETPHIEPGYKPLPGPHTTSQTTAKKSKGVLQVPKCSKKDSKSSQKYECSLCPNNLPSFLHNIIDFQLINTDLKDKKSRTLQVHRICAEQFPGQIRIEDNVAIGMQSISKSQKKLKCTVCKNQNLIDDHGACYQCSYEKCVRAFHGTCGLVSGVLYQKDNEHQSNLCKFHRNKSSIKQEDEFSNLTSNYLVQFNLPNSKEMYCGYVVSNNTQEEAVYVLVYPNMNDLIEIPYENLVRNSSKEVLQVVPNENDNMKRQFEEAYDIYPAKKRYNSMDEYSQLPSYNLDHFKVSSQVPSLGQYNFNMAEPMKTNDSNSLLDSNREKLSISNVINPITE